MKCTTNRYLKVTQTFTATPCRSSSKVKVIGQSSRSLDVRYSFTGYTCIRWTLRRDMFLRATAYML